MSWNEKPYGNRNVEVDSGVIHSKKYLLSVHHVPDGVLESQRYISYQKPYNPGIYILAEEMNKQTIYNKCHKN